MTSHLHSFTASLLLTCYICKEVWNGEKAKVGLSCDTEGRDWLRLRTPEGGREFAAPGPGQQPGSSNPPHTTAAGVTTFSRTGEKQEAGEVKTVITDD